MDNVTPLRVDGAADKAAREAARRLAGRFGVTQAELHAAIKPMFLLMYDHGIGSLTIDRDDTRAVVTIDGQRM
jgi:hypothetical protein